MSNIALALVSLIAAVPGGVLTVMLVMNCLGRPDKLSGMLWVLSIVTLLTSVLVTVLPGGVLLFGPKGDKAGRKKKGKEDEGEAEEEDVDLDDEGATLLDAGHEADLEDAEDLVAGEGDELSMEADELDEEAEEEDATATLDVEDGEDLFMEDEGDFDLEFEDEDEK